MNIDYLKNYHFLHQNQDYVNYIDFYTVRSLFKYIISIICSFTYFFEKL